MITWTRQAREAKAHGTNNVVKKLHKYLKYLMLRTEIEKRESLKAHYSPPEFTTSTPASAKTLKLNVLTSVKSKALRFAYFKDILTPRAKTIFIHCLCVNHDQVM